MSRLGGPSEARGLDKTRGRRLRLDDLLVTDKLRERTNGGIDAVSEAAAFRELSSLLVRRPRSTISRFVQIALRLCPRAGTVGVSELQTNRRHDYVLTPTEVAGLLDTEDLRGSEWLASPFASCLQSRRAVLLDRPARLYPELSSRAPLFEVLAVPLLGRGRRPLGVVWAAAHTDREGFSSADAEFFERLAPQLVLALTLRRAEERRHGLQERLFSSTKVAEEARLLGRLFDQAPGFIAVLRGPEHEFIFANKAYRRLVRRQDLAGRRVASAFPYVEEQGFVALLDEAFTTGRAVVGEGLRANFAPAGVQPQVHYLDFVYQPVKDRAGRVQGIFVEGHDVTARVLNEERASLISQESSHRVKNTLATVQAIAAHTGRTSPDLPAFLEAFEARLIALAKTNDLLIAHAWKGAPLRGVMALELGLFQEKTRVSGPRVMLNPREAGAVGMIVHELVTNSSKYGAFAAREGRVKICWRVCPDGGRLVLEWVERGGPRVSAPAEFGFGTRLIRRLAERDLDGEARFAFDPSGLSCEITARLEACRR